MSHASRQSMMDQAAEWVSRMDGLAWSKGDEERLQRWLAEDVRHAGALLQAEAAWMTLDHDRHAERLLKSPRPVHRGLMPRRRFLAAGGAAIAASVAAGFGFIFRGSTYETAKGEMIRMPLADGSVAAINTDSKLLVQLEQARRLIRLTRGEAWFQVAKDHTRPFIVEAGGATVVAVGTAFSVRRNGGSVDVLVTEGVVRASSGGKDGVDLFLSAGERATLRQAILRRVPSTPSSVDQTLAWRDGKIDLSGEKLRDAIAEFNRYNERQILLGDLSIGDERLDGLFRTDDVEGFAEAVHNALGVPVSLNEGADIWIGRRPVA